MHGEVKDDSPQMRSRWEKHCCQSLELWFIRDMYPSGIHLAVCCYEHTTPRRGREALKIIFKHKDLPLCSVLIHH